MTTGKGMIEIIDWLESAATWIDGHPGLDCDGDPEGLLLKTWNVGKLREAAALLRLSETPPRQETPEDQSRLAPASATAPARLTNASATETASDGVSKPQGENTMTIQEIKAYAEVMIALAEVAGKLEEHHRVGVVVAAMQCCGTPTGAPTEAACG